MTWYRTWCFDNYYVRKKYLDNPKALDHQLQTVYQQGRYIFSSRLDEPLIDGLHLLEMTPQVINKMIGGAKQANTHITAYELVDTNTGVIHFVPRQLFDGLFSNAIEPRNYEILVLRLRQCHLKILKLHLNYAKLPTSEITLVPPFEMTFDHLPWAKFRHIWTKMVGNGQAELSLQHRWSYPMLFDPVATVLPDFGITIASKANPKFTRHSLQRYLYDNYTVSELPVASEICDYQYRRDQQADYVTITRKKLRKVAAKNAELQLHPRCPIHWY